jgi:hypothetical protein
MVEQAKKNLAEFESCQLHVLVLLLATSRFNSNETTKLRMNQMDRLRNRYPDKIPKEQFINLICAWASDDELLMYSKMREFEKILLAITICKQCAKIKMYSDSLEKKKQIQSLMFNCN